MKALYKRISLGLILTFIVMMFQPISSYAKEGANPSLSMNSEGNYTVSSVEDLNKLRSDIDKGIDYSGKYIILTQDIDISKSEVKLNSFTSKNKFNGTFNGKFHTISAYTDAKSGIFSLVDKDGVVENIRVSADLVINNESQIIGKFDSGMYGLIANYNEGKITCCSTTGMLKINVKCSASGIVGSNELKDLTNCYSDIIFNNQVEKGRMQLAGICRSQWIETKYCYFYGKFIGNDLKKSDKDPIGNKSKTCAYDQTVLGFSGVFNAKRYTTEEMKNKDTYIALGFDFDKCWSIDLNINDGYPYLDSQKEGKALDIPLDIGITIADKTYDPRISLDENFKATVTNVEIVTPNEEIKKLIDKYNVKLAYTVKSATFSPTVGEWPVEVYFDKLELKYDSNDEYKFVLNHDKNFKFKANGKLLEIEQPGPTEDKKIELIEKAKKAQDIMYKKFNFGQGAIDEFSWTTELNGSRLYTDMWGTFSSARSGYRGVRKGYYDEWFKSVQDGLKKMKESGIEGKNVSLTDWAKLVLAITAAGYDARDVEAYDLIDIISSKDCKSGDYFSEQYRLYALDSHDYPIPKGENRINKEATIHKWAEASLKSIGVDGSVAYENMAPDMWTMAGQPIARYYDPNAKEGDQYYDVKVAVDHMLNRFSHAQTFTGSFWGGFKKDGVFYDIDNPWTNAQVYMTLGLARVDIFGKRYIKNGNTILDAALQFYDFQKNEVSYFNEKDYDVLQVCRGLESLVRACEGRNSIFDCRDVKDSTVPVNNAILALPNKITSANKAQVEEAERLYNALSDNKKASIKASTKEKLIAAKAKLASGDEAEVKGLKIENITDKIAVSSDGKAKMIIKVTNEGTDTKEVTLILTVFDKKGALINYCSPNVKIKAGESKKIEAEFKLPKELGYRVKAFIWNSLEGMVPLLDVIE